MDETHFSRPIVALGQVYPVLEPLSFALVLYEGLK